MTDPRRAKIAEAMEARARWERRQQPSGIPYPTDAMAFTREATEALPAAVELIDELTAEVERLHGFRRRVPELEATVVEVTVRAEKAEAEVEHWKTEHNKAVLVVFDAAGDKVRINELTTEAERLTADRDRWHARAMDLLAGKELLGD